MPSGNSIFCFMKIEVCIASVASAIAAQEGGADRVELCDNLFEGGTTPSLAMIEQVRKQTGIGLYVMIRPRGGDFLYSDEEFEIMKGDLMHAKKAGADGVVFGLLKADGSVDLARTSELVQLASPLDTTFHRAFDMAANPQEALEAVIRSGCQRILTAGGANKAIDGIERIAQLQQQASNRIQLMAGSGINEQNARLFLEKGIRELHLSGKIVVDGNMTYRNPQVMMGGLPGIPEYEYIVTDAGKIRAVREAVEKG